MKNLLICAALMLACVAPCRAAGFQTALVPGQDGAPIEVAIWYPSADPVRPKRMGTFSQDVASDGAILGTGLPLVLMSHGSGGFAYSHADTALALAEAGFVVAALTHPGDNYRDQSRSIEVLERPAQVVATLDFLLGGWVGRERIAAGRVGMFGFSAGGFTALVNIGGTPDLRLAGAHCASHPSDYACGVLANNKGKAPLQLHAAQNMYERRIRAAVIAAPALGFAFDAAGLRAVTIPVQLWRAQEDVLLPHPWYAEAVRLALPQQPDYRTVAGAGHFDFLAPCNAMLAAVAPQICQSQEGFDRARFHVQFNADVVAFFQKTL